MLEMFANYAAKRETRISSILFSIDEGEAVVFVEEEEDRALRGRS